MNKSLFYIGITVSFLLQLTCVELIALRGYRPDFILIFILLYFIGSGKIKPMLAGFFIGLIQDLIGGGFIGLNAVSKTTAGFILGLLFPEKPPDTKGVFYSSLILCIFTHDLLYHYIFSRGGYEGFLMFLWKQVLPFSLYNFFICVLISLLPSFKLDYKS